MSLLLLIASLLQYTMPLMLLTAATFVCIPLNQMNDRWRVKQYLTATVAKDTLDTNGGDSNGLFLE